MSGLSNWKYLTVREFLEGYNWLGKPISQTDTGHFSEASESIFWQCETVQTFFSHFNWTGRSVEQSAIVSAPQTFSTRLSVQDFFQFFAWEGQPNIAAVPNIPQSSPITVEDDLNLNDFSGMF